MLIDKMRSLILAPFGAMMLLPFIVFGTGLAVLALAIVGWPVWLLIWWLA